MAGATAATSFAEPVSTTRPRGELASLDRWGRLRWLPIAFGVAALCATVVLGVAVGPAGLPVRGVLKEMLGMRSGLGIGSTIVWQFRLSRVVLGLLVGAVLSLAGGSFQGAFRNPLADPYLLGVAGGGGLGATLAIVSSANQHWVPPAAFAGALLAVGLTYLLGASGHSPSPASLVLAGVAVTSLLTAFQTFVQQRNTNDIRSIYGWILGRLSTSGWSDVLTLLPYAVVSSVVLLLMARSLDVLSVGDVEAQSLGLRPARLRLIIVVAASLATAAAVSVSGLIAFVGLIVPHTIRLLAGSSYRRILPLSMLYGGVFLALADLLARTVLAPAEIPIGVVTAFFGAPFFLIILRSSRNAS